MARVEGSSGRGRLSAFDAARALFDGTLASIFGLRNCCMQDQTFVCRLSDIGILGS